MISPYLINRLRSITALIMFSFVFIHLSNHILGIVGIEAMESMRQITTKILHSTIGTGVLVLSIIVHFCIAMSALYHKPFLSLPRWQQLQLASGITMILLLIPHVVPVRGMYIGYNIETSYPLVLQHLWNDTQETIRQLTLLLVSWLHICLGLHYWLRTKSWYYKNLYWIYALAILWPTLAAIGFFQAGYEAYEYDIFETNDPGISNLINTVENILLAVVIGMSLLMLFLKWLRKKLINPNRACTISMTDNQIKSAMGQTILNALRFADLPHPSVCGGRARCTTCRVRVNQGMESLAPIGELEALALNRINAPPGVRLACQASLTGNVNITALLPVDASMKHAHPTGGISGEEQEIVAMFVDLRESTKMAEHKLPYDVLFLLNQFFSQMSKSLSITQGHYAQFAGDGLMALYGLDSDSKSACKQALTGARDMLKRLDKLNKKLHTDLEQPLKIGIGLHFGEAIVGNMGPPKSPNFSAIGDTINTTARLEAHTKTLNCQLIVSRQLLMHCGADFKNLQSHTIEIRGRHSHMTVFCINSTTELDALIQSIVS